MPCTLNCFVSRINQICIIHIQILILSLLQNCLITSTAILFCYYYWYLQRYIFISQSDLYNNYCINYTYWLSICICCYTMHIVEPHVAVTDVKPGYDVCYLHSCQPPSFSSNVDPMTTLIQLRVTKSPIAEQFCCHMTLNVTTHTQLL